MPFTKPATIRQVAARAKCSPMTVSRVLRGDSSVRPEFKGRVMEAARELGYGVNPLVSAFMSHLRSTRNSNASANLAWVTDERLDIRWRQDLFESAKARAEAKRFTLDPINLSREKLSSTRLEGILEARGVLGVILDVINFSTVVEIDHDKFEIVAIGHIPRNMSVNRIVSNEFQNLTLACKTLHQKGFRRIGLFLNRYLDIASESHYRGAYLAFQELLPPDQRLPACIVADPREFALERHYWEWYEQYKPEVVICQMAKVRDWSERQGLRIPDDLNLVHLSIAPDVADWAGINQHQRDIGNIAVELLTNNLYVRNSNVLSVRYNVQLRGHWVDGLTLGESSA